MKLRSLLLCLLVAGVNFLASAQDSGNRRYALPNRLMPLEKALIDLTEAGAELSYRPDLLPKVAIRVPGGRRTLERWLKFLLQDTELTYERGAAGYLILPDPDLLGKTFNVFGMVTDARTGERLIGATVQLPELAAGTQTNEYGFYTFPVAGGRQRLRITYIGYIPREVNTVVRADSLIDIALQPNRELPQIIVTAAGSDSTFNHYGDSGIRIGRSEVAQLGGPGGESDPLRLTRLLPGVTSGSDGVGGIFVRGSEAGQNLVLLDGVPVYSLSHAGGLFSIFSNQAIRRIDLYKDALPARFGGRIGGVLDVHTRDGNLYNNELTIGTSLLSSQVAAEGPITKGESSFLLTGRYFWAGELLRKYSEEYKARRGRRGSTDYNVHDLNFKLNQKAGERGRIYLSLYTGLDDYGNNSWQSDTITILNDAGARFINTTPVSRNEHVKWGNTVGALRYNHVFSDRTFGNFRLSYSDLLTESTFERSDSVNEITNNFYKGSIFSGSYASEIRQVGFAFDGQHGMTSGNEIRFGAEINLHRFQPQLNTDRIALENLPEIGEFGDNEALRPIQLSTYGSYEGRFRALYYRLGLRGSLWRNQYTNYYKLSPRVLLAGPLNERTDWQLSYDRTVQPIHLLNSNVIGLPSDLWVPSTREIAPATAPQISGKLSFRPSESWRLEASAYLKRMRNLVAYREGGQSQREWIDDLSTGRGKAYGLETSVQRSRGRLRGWLSYTLAKSQRQFDNSINQGAPFPFRYDRRHSLNMLLVYQLGDRTTITGSWTYESGLAYSLSLETLPVYCAGTLGDNCVDEVPFYGERNGYRMKANHRLDLNLHTVLNAEGSRFTHAIDFGIYNVYNRHNPVYYDPRPEYYNERDNLSSRTQFYQIYIAPMLPALSYHLTFSSDSRRIFGR